MSTLLTEIRDVLTTRPRLRKWIILDLAQQFDEAIEALVDPDPDPDLVEIETRDSDDDYLVALARTHNVDLIVTGDKDLLEWDGQQPPAVTPRERPRSTSARRRPHLVRPSRRRGLRTGRRVGSARRGCDLAARKVLAILDRAEGRDFSDLLTLAGPLLPFRLRRMGPAARRRHLPVCQVAVADAFGRLRRLRDHEIPSDDAERIRHDFANWAAELRST